MFTQLRIQNFKAWKDTGNIRLAPLTVFFGPNSSGKTSLLQFLLMLKQTAQSPNPKQVMNFGGDGRSFVDLGIWPEMVFAHDARQSLGFELEWQVPHLPLVGVTEPRWMVVTFQAKVGTSEENAPLGVRMFRYEVNPWKGHMAAFSLGMDYSPALGEYEFWHRDDTGRIVSARKSEAPMAPLPQRKLAPVHFYGFPLDTSVFYTGTGFTDDATLLLTQQLDSLRYLGPLRQMPRRLYAWSGATPPDVGIYGEQVVEAILAARDQVLLPADGGDPIRFEELIARWLKRMGLLESFSAKPIAPNRKEYEVLVQTPGSRKPVSLVDVGFGVSQVLPVLVQLFYVAANSVLIFEQPEIHLHPRAQSELADLFIEAIQMREQSWPRNIQLLVESHSEHFLRRIQRRIAEGVLAPEQTALYFCKPGPDGSTIEELQVDKYGRISNWPENFFGDAIGDTEEQMDAMLRRMEQEEPSASG
ncbi:AAA family ATPase [Archangium sp.]|jgi:hypothetical protein|uniref:AAA family ATPase n=1 Tax=Archangium sp. TaxID=1872627 RepID=UPI002ED7927B